LGQPRTEIFLQKGLDRPVTEQPVGQISWPVCRCLKSEGGWCGEPKGEAKIGAPILLSFGRFAFTNGVAFIIVLTLSERLIGR
jgi:hypothetical protein